MAQEMTQKVAQKARMPMQKDASCTGAQIHHFWNWTDDPDTGERVLHLNGTIAEESWYDDDLTPEVFEKELHAGNGPITIWLNSPGGDCIAAARIYNMLMDYQHDVTVKIDGIAASAASVIAMAGTKVLMSPVSTMMIHNPATIAFGDHAEMSKAIEMLDAVKDSIINAYEIKTGLSRKELSRLMDAETWMDATKAVELGFADGILQRDGIDAKKIGAKNIGVGPVLFSQKRMDTVLVNRMTKRPEDDGGVPVKPLYDRLNKLR